MNIGIIGGALARRFLATGHDVTIADSRGPASLADLAAETGARAGSVADAVAGQDLTVSPSRSTRYPHRRPGCSPTRRPH